MAEGVEVEVVCARAPSSHTGLRCTLRSHLGSEDQNHDSEDRSQVEAMGEEEAVVRGLS